MIVLLVSLFSISDDYSRDPVGEMSSEMGEEKPIEPISDIEISYINELMFGSVS